VNVGAGPEEEDEVIFGQAYQFCPQVLDPTAATYEAEPLSAHFQPPVVGTVRELEALLQFFLVERF
jgi:hypothetical protein